MFTLAQKGGVQFSMLTSSRLALLVAIYDGTPYRGWTDVRDSVLRPTLQSSRFFVLRTMNCHSSSRSADDEAEQMPEYTLFGQVCSLSRLHLAKLNWIRGS